MKFEKHIKVTNTGTHYETKIIAGNHLLTTDEPLDHGGQDKGPTAHQMLLSALGACTAITLRMYADRKQWDLQKIHVSLNMEKVMEGNEESLISCNKIPAGIFSKRLLFFFFLIFSFISNR